MYEYVHYINIIINDTTKQTSLTHSYSPVTKSSVAIAGQTDAIRNPQPCLLSNRYSQRCHLIHMKLEVEEWKNEMYMYTEL